MALTNANDISLVLSGGSLNNDPNLSIGGPSSATAVVDGILNNLFDNVTPDQTETGHVDYRAIYFANDGDTTIFNVEFFITDEVPEGSSILIGTENRDELQRVSIEGAITGGFIEFEINDFSFTVFASPSNVTQWAQDFQDAMRAIVSGSEIIFPDVTVTGLTSPGFFVFSILFEGRNGNTNQDDIIYTNNSLTVSSGTSTIVITTLQNGAPINTIAQELANETETPAAVGFFFPIQSSPISFAAMRPADFVPIWVRRETLAGALAVSNDGFTLRFRAESLDPALFA
jgi:hypothetical protein